MKAELPPHAALFPQDAPQKASVCPEEAAGPRPALRLLEVPELGHDPVQ